MSALLERLGVELPVVQAGMGGGVSRAPLAAAVSEAGGLGTLCTLPVPELELELVAARELTSRPLAINMLLPFTERSHWEIAERADVVVTFWGRPRRRTSRPWLHQCGSLGEALAAHEAGADGVIAQGVEAGGHVRGTVPARRLLEEIRSALPGFPVLSAGAIPGPAEAAERLAAGAEAVVCGTRFLMSGESSAQPEYKLRLLAAEETVLTELFGFGWPAPHRVVDNEATRRWLRRDRRGPAWVRAINRLTGPAISLLPFALQVRMSAAQRPGVPLLGPAPPTEGLPEELVEAGPLYAGESVAAIADLRPAGDLVRELAGA